MSKVYTVLVYVTIAGLAWMVYVSQDDLAKAKVQVALHLEAHEATNRAWARESNDLRKKVVDLEKEVILCDKQLSHKTEQLAARDALLASEQKLYGACYEELRSAKILIEELNKFLDGIPFEELLALKQGR